MLGHTPLGAAALGQGAGKQFLPVTGYLDATETGPDGCAISGVVGIVGSVAAAEIDSDVLAFSGGPVVEGALAVTDHGHDTAALAGDTVAGAVLSVSEAGDDTASGNILVTVSASFSLVEIGADAFAQSGVVIVEGAFAAVEEGADIASIAGYPEMGGLNAHETGYDTAALTGEIVVSGSLAAIEAGDDVLAFSGGPLVHGGFHIGEIGDDVLAFAGEPVVSGELHVAETYGLDSFAGAGSSSAYVPRDPALGLIHLVEIDGYDPASDEIVTFRFGSEAFNSRPVDMPADAYYEDALDTPGNFSRALFSGGATTGIARVGYGEVVLINSDGHLDAMERCAFDGRRLRVLSMEKRKPLLTRALVLFDGTMDQAEFSWGRVTIRLRDRLAELDRPLQDVLYAGTTFAGGMNEAEGTPDDLKDRPKPNAYGAPLNVAAVEANRFDRIYDLGIDGLDAIATVRDRGVALTPTGNDYPTLAALRTASIPEGRFATQLVRGRIRLGSEPKGEITADPVRGGSAPARTAGQVARQILLDAGMSEGTDFLASDVTALDAACDAEVALWTGTEETSALQAIGRVLSSIGAAIAPDRSGRYRMIRHAAPSGEPAITITDIDFFGSAGRGIERRATGDQGNGVPVWRVNIQYGRNHTPMRPGDLDMVNIAADFRAWAAREWRTAVASDEDVRTRHLLASEMTAETCLLHRDDAEAEAQRRLALYSVPRSLFIVPVKSILVERVDLGDVVRLQVRRFGLDAGKDFRVIGITEEFKTNTTTLELWG